MKKQLLLVLIFGLVFCNPLMSQDDCPCCTESHRAFDFWVGDWIVVDTSETIVGENTIIKLEDGCILNEHWRGTQGSTGRSYNYYNRADSTWNQVWIDNNGGILNLKGYADEGKMILDSELLQGKKVPWYKNRITWTENEDGSVTQLWEILDEQDGLLQVAFHGIYRQKE